MKEIMTVEDSFSTKEAGVIVSGVNTEFDPLDQSEIKQLIGDRIRIVVSEGLEIDVNVRDIAISESIVGKKNISIAVGELEGVDQVSRGSMIYAIE
ncbi:MAG: hypothetical protein KZQ97_21765 [Candidatus Thiodiazotropha sp. (ex Dulcina madagascariensis)]|nr:hypothetical protein [Candidatus Thiodiazotropha sp. (ex Dulcina madagascariensis)]